MLLGQQFKGQEDLMKTLLFFPRIFRLRFSMRARCLEILTCKPWQNIENTFLQLQGQTPCETLGPQSQKSNSEASSSLSRLLSYFFWNKHLMITSFCKIARRLLLLFSGCFVQDFTQTSCYFNLIYFYFAQYHKY